MTSVSHAWYRTCRTTEPISSVSMYTHGAAPAAMHGSVHRRTSAPRRVWRCLHFAQSILLPRLPYALHVFSACRPFPHRAVWHISKLTHPRHNFPGAVSPDHSCSMHASMRCMMHGLRGRLAAAGSLQVVTPAGAGGIHPAGSLLLCGASCSSTAIGRAPADSTCFLDAASLS